MNQNGKKKSPQPRAKGVASSVRRGKNHKDLFPYPNRDQSSETQSSGGERERIRIHRKSGKGSVNGGGLRTDGEVVNELIQVTRDCIAALEDAASVGKAYLDRLESMKTSIDSQAEKPDN